MLVTNKNFPQVMERLEHQPRLIHDTETTGLRRWHDDVIVSHIIATPNLGKEVYYFPIRHKIGENLTDIQHQWVRALLSDPQKVYTGYNYKFDIEMGLKDGIPIPRRSEDIMLSAHLLNENEPSFKLKEYSDKYIDPESSAAEKKLINRLRELGFSGKESIGELDPKDPVVADYGCQDAVLTEKNRMLHLEGLRDWGLGDIWNEVNDYMMSTVRMEQRGMRLDRGMVQRNIDEAEIETEKAYAVLAELAGYDINPRSNPQMQAFLGLKSTKKEILEEIREGNPAIDAVINYRGWSKANNTYYLPYLEHMDSEGILHPNLNLHGTISGRPSADNPNMQAVPRYTKIYKIKDVFMARKGHVLLSCDYSQAELRLACHIAREMVMAKILNSGGDIHAATAAEMSVDRDVAKRINFGVLYGIGARKLSKTLRIPEAEARKYLNIYHDKFRKLRPFYRYMEMVAQYQGYIRLWTGRVRRYNTVWAQPHKALSNFVQGGVAEMMRHAILKLDQDVQLGYFHMLLQVHDQILFEVPIETANECAAYIKYTMEDFPQFESVPPKVDVSIGKRWGNLQKWTPETPYVPTKRAA